MTEQKMLAGNPVIDQIERTKKARKLLANKELVEALENQGATVLLDLLREDAGLQARKHVPVIPGV